MDEPLAGKLFHHSVHTASAIKILQVMFSCRAQLAKVRSPFTHTIKGVKLKPDPGLPRNGYEMKDRIRRTPQGHIDCHGICKGILRHDFSGRYPFFQKHHNIAARGFGQACTSGHDCRDGAVSGKAHADGLGQAIHGIGREHSGARAACRTGVVFYIGQLLFTQLT